MIFHFRGTALGGWLVLEPWLTPSLFYQFLGASKRFGDEAPKHVGLDTYTFCTSLGDEEANRQLRRHWKTWVTEDQISNLQKIGVDTLRIPVGDWMYVPYEPYIGCMDGSLEELDRVLDLCRIYNINVIIDIHAIVGSQNGLDNSGNTGNLEWVSTKSTGGAARYKHWEIRGGNWIGDFNVKTQRYDNINYANIDHALLVVKNVVDRYRNNSIVIGLEPLNEPWWLIPMDVLQGFYQRSNNIIQSGAPHWITLLHDSFRLHHEVWGEFMSRCVNCALDAHLYQAWAWATDPEWFTADACTEGEKLRALEASGLPIVVGEWSLATDNCAMWINGLNDNVPGYPIVECERIQCPPPYMGSEQPGAPPDPSLPALDPFGTGGESYVINGTCPRDHLFPNDDQVMRKLGYIKMKSYDLSTHGNFFWNFRTEFEPRWDFQQAVAHGWLPHEFSAETIAIIDAACNDPYYIPQGPLTDSFSLTKVHPRAWKSSSYAILTCSAAVLFSFILVLAIFKRYRHKRDTEFHFYIRLL